ncbi:MAG: DUF523 domain-containing protein [Candidatus Eisenbacteria sp.]|nr:DUF523 domain-containing protein [Candidatus Eisenbacteria bacterium]
MRGISACLLGIACRYDGQALPHTEALRAAAGGSLIPLCPEQLGGLPTPRPPAQITGGDGEDVLNRQARVIDEHGRDVTKAFLRGATETVTLCKRLGIVEVLLKSRSPSCGVGMIYHGRQLVKGDGVTAAMLRRHCICVICHPD